MRVQALGHVVLKVRSFEKSVPFYRDVLGFKEVGRWRNMAFFSLGASHHDLGLAEVGGAAKDAPADSVGLVHVALKVGDSLETLKKMKAHLEKHGVAVLGAADHKVSQSLYIEDPDGIELELYVDADPRIWKDDPSAVASVGPLRL